MRARHGSLAVAALLLFACSNNEQQPGGWGDGSGGRLEFGHVERGAAQKDARPDLSFDSGPLPDVDVGKLPNPSCEFLTPKDGDRIADNQTYVAVQTRYAPAGTVVALLVDYAPQRTTVVDSAGQAEFVTVPLPAPSDKRVELRAEVRLYPMHKVSCWIFITVAAP